MHIFISGIAGSGLSSIAHLCLDLGFKVSGSDINQSKNVESLIKRGLEFEVGQKSEFLKKQHQVEPISYYIHSPAVPKDALEIVEAHNLGLNIGKQNLLINFLIQEKNLKLVAVAGTHGKTTTTAMLVWLFQKLNLPVSYIIGTNISFGNSGQYQIGSKYLIYEADEYDKKFLDLHPDLSLIVSLDYDHPDIYPTKKSYLEAFAQFVSQSRQIISFYSVTNLYRPFLNKIKLGLIPKIAGGIEEFFEENHSIGVLTLPGKHSRQNAQLALYTMGFILGKTDYISLLEAFKKFNFVDMINAFPGTARRFERLLDNLYTDYAHHPNEIGATLQLAREFLEINKPNFKLLVIYQPHQNSRQHELLNEYQDCFNQADLIYWLPTFLSREDPNLKIFTPEEIYKNVNSKVLIKPFKLDQELIEQVKIDLKGEYFILLLGAGTIDDWFRENLAQFFSEEF